MASPFVQEMPVVAKVIVDSGSPATPAKVLSSSLGLVAVALATVKAYEEVPSP